jgi:hypothetical protein
LTPSPVIATTFPSARRASAIRSLASGELRAKMSSRCSRRISSSSGSLRRSSCSPVMTVAFSPAMPTRWAIAAAVRPLSPVMTMMRMPASWQAATAAVTSARGRVGHRDQAEEAEASFCFLAVLRYGLGRLEPALGDGVDAQPLPGVVVVQPQDLSALCPAERALLSVALDHRRAARQQRLRRSLRVDPPVAVAVVDRGHELEHRIEVEVP